MIDEIVDLVVAVNQCSSILRLRSRILEERYRVVVVWDFAYSDLCLYIDRLGLRSRNGAEGLDLSVVKAEDLPKLSMLIELGVIRCNFASVRTASCHLCCVRRHTQSYDSQLTSPSSLLQ